MIEPISKKQDISPTELDNVYKAVKTIYYIETIKAMKEYGDYSFANGSSYRGNSRAYRGSYDGRMGMDADNDGRYSERRGRYSNGYSRDEEKDEAISYLEKMMKESNSDADRQTIRDYIRRIENEM